MNKYKQELAKAAAEVEKAKKEKSSASKQVNSIEREMRLREGYISEVEEERRGVEHEMAVAQWVPLSMEFSRQEYWSG